jgi:hypothetical protein
LLLLGGLIAAGALAFAAYDWANGPEFSPAKWRDARASDSEELDLLATDAVESEALIARSRRELRLMLGRPDRVDKARNAWVWDIGLANDYYGPGDDATLVIRFSRSTGRSNSATIGPVEIGKPSRSRPGGGYTPGGHLWVSA